MASYPTLFFLSHMQRGVVRYRDASGQVRASVTLEAGENAGEAAQSLGLLGPEHVDGIAPDQILRLVPSPDSADFEPNGFPAVDFALPDLPWMFTPEGKVEDATLSPWIVLAVVEVQSGVALQQPAGQGLPVLQIRTPAVVNRELPDLEESWAWAHVQCSADLARLSIEDAFAQEPERFRSRLLCPRRLKPLTDYIACVIPATRGGVQKGLGITVGDDPHEPAWSGDESSLDLPVYHSWRFRTAQRGDFEALVRKLAPRDLQAGTAGLDLSHPGDPRLPEGEEMRVTFRGALVGTSAKRRKWPHDHQQAYLEGMGEILATHRPGKTLSATGTYDALRDDPVVAPPLWGALKIGAESAPRPPRAGTLGKAGWFTGVNYDPANRAAAGLGAECIRRNQEALMAEAWRQVEGLREVNRTLNTTRFAAETTGALKTAKVDRLEDAEATSLAATARARIPGRFGAANLAAEQSATASPDGIYTPAMARLARRKGPLGRRSQLHEPLSAAGIKWFATKPQKALTFSDFVTPAKLGSDDLIMGLRPVDTPDTATGAAPQPRKAERTPGHLARPVLGATSPKRAPVKQTVAVSRAPVKQKAAPPGRAPVLKAQSTQAALVQARLSFDPVPVLSARLKARVRVPPPVFRDTPLPRPLLVEPRFDLSGYTMLRAISPDAVMPGVGQVPLNSVGLATVNADFVESWLLGANAEMAREMLWREYPGRLDGTYFRRFWDTPGRTDDVNAIADWKPGMLGTHQTGPGKEGTLVLLVKGEVLARYPELRIYASRAMWDDLAGRKEMVKDDRPYEARDPVFGGWLNRTTAFFAFDLSLEEAKGTREFFGPEPGWYFVFEQPREGVQFGLDVPSGGRVEKPRWWQDLHWGHALDDPRGGGDETHVSIARGVGAQELRYSPDSFSERWGRSASAQARITFQKPMRVLMHASAMLP